MRRIRSSSTGLKHEKAELKGEGKKVGGGNAVVFNPKYYPEMVVKKGIMHLVHRVGYQNLLLIETFDL